MGVDTQRHGRIGVAQPLSHHMDRFAVLEQERGVHVSQGVEADRRHDLLLAIRRRNVLRINSPGRSVRSGEDAASGWFPRQPCARSVVRWGG